MRISICALAMVGVGAFARTAAADAPKLAHVKGALPAGVKPSAALKHAETFTDKNGTNYVLFSEKDGGRSMHELFVDHWVVPAGSQPKLLRTVKELVDDCDLDLVAEFHDAATGVTDLDGDGYGEVTFAYEVGCRSDVSPDDYKLLLLENGDKYILRGQTKIATHDPDQPTAGGDFKPDPAKGKWPAKFYDHAVELWKQTSVDGTMPPLGPNDHD
jgi:hypothetical protein